MYLIISLTQSSTLQTPEYVSTVYTMVYVVKINPWYILYKIGEDGLFHKTHIINTNKSDIPHLTKITKTKWFDNVWYFIGHFY